MKMLKCGISLQVLNAGWPRHRENREFGSYFSRQGKHREFYFDTGKNFETQGKYVFVTQGKIRHRENI